MLYLRILGSKNGNLLELGDDDGVAIKLPIEEGLSLKNGTNEGVFIGDDEGFLFLTKEGAGNFLIVENYKFHGGVAKLKNNSVEILGLFRHEFCGMYRDGAVFSMNDGDVVAITNADGEFDHFFVATNGEIREYNKWDMILAIKTGELPELFTIGFELGRPYFLGEEWEDLIFLNGDWEDSDLD